MTTTSILAPTKAELTAAAETLCATAFASTVFPDNATAQEALRDKIAPVLNEEIAERRRWVEDFVTPYLR